jgi:sec-independent protein translocase protein TatC
MAMTDERRDSALDESRMTIWEHLAELRSRLIRVLVAIALGMALAFAFYNQILEFVLAPYRSVKPDATLYVPGIVEGFAMRIQASMYLGIGLAMPVIMWQLWRFVTPALYPHEKRYAVPFTISACVLFFMGAGIAYISLVPTITFLTEFAGPEVVQLPTVESYFKLILFMMLAFGAGFEFPVVLVGLQLVGVLTPRKLLAWWRYATVTICIVAAVITPGGDPVSMLALATPMFLLYFLSIGIGAVFARRREATPAPV